MMKNKFLIMFYAVFLSLFGCSEKPDISQDFPEIYETTFKTEKVYFYDIEEFSNFFFSSLKNASDAGFFMREPELYFIWKSGGFPKKDFYSSQRPRNNINGYHTSIFLSDKHTADLILESDGSFNPIPKPFFIQLTEGDFNSTAAGYELTEITMDYELFENILNTIVKDDQTSLKLYRLDYDGNKLEDEIIIDKKSFLELNGLGMGSFGGNFTHPEIGEIQIGFEKSCGNGRGVGCYGDGTFILPIGH